MLGGGGGLVSTAADHHRFTQMLHALRFYTMEHHTDRHPGQTTTIHDPRETAERREQAERTGS